MRVQATRLRLNWRIRKHDSPVVELAGIFGVDIRWADSYRVPAQAVRDYLLCHFHVLEGCSIDLACIVGIMAGPEPGPR